MKQAIAASGVTSHLLIKDPLNFFAVEHFHHQQQKHCKANRVCEHLCLSLTVRWLRKCQVAFSLSSLCRQKPRIRLHGRLRSATLATVLAISPTVWVEDVTRGRGWIPSPELQGVAARYYMHTYTHHAVSSNPLEWAEKSWMLECSGCQSLLNPPERW